MEAVGTQSVAPGKIIVIDGLDASGKQKHSKALVVDLQVRGLQAKRYDFPNYESETGKAILNHLQNRWQAASTRPAAEGGGYYGPCKYDPLVFQALQTLNRLELVPFILRDLAEGTWLVFDRYWPSGVAYGASDGMPPLWLEAVHETLPRAALTVFMDISPEESIRRRPDRRDRYEKQPGLMEVVRANYRELFARRQADPHTRWKVLDAMGEFPDVHRRLLDLVDSVLPGKVTPLP